MSRLMSVALTEPQVLLQSKDVTRRLNWWEDKYGRRLLSVGDRLTLCHKVMGRKKGEPLVRIAEVEVVDISREQLNDITFAEVAREGFPDWTPDEFVTFFCATHKGCTPTTEVTRIEWRYIEGGR